MDATCSGQLPPSNNNNDIDLRLLFGISKQDCISEISNLIEDKKEYIDLVSPFLKAIKTLELSKIEWRGLDPESLMPRKFVSMVYDGLNLALRNKIKEKQIDDDYKINQKISKLFSKSEWEGIILDMSRFSPEYKQVVGKHCFDGKRIHPQINVIPKESTSRMGTRGGFNVMGWKKSERNALIAPPGFKIYSIDFNAMDVHSLASLFPESNLSSVIEFDGDTYSQISIEFGLSEDRNLVKSTFLPIIYGVSNSTLSESTGIKDSDIQKVRLLIKPILSKMPCGTDLARLVQETSSIVFRKTLADISDKISTCCTALFPIHDEIIFLSQSDNDIFNIANCIEQSAKDISGSRYKTRVSSGIDFGNMVRL